MRYIFECLNCCEIREYNFPIPPIPIYPFYKICPTCYYWRIPIHILRIAFNNIRANVLKFYFQIKITK